MHSLLGLSGNLKAVDNYVFKPILTNKPQLMVFLMVFSIVVGKNIIFQWFPNFVANDIARN